MTTAAPFASRLGRTLRIFVAGSSVHRTAIHAMIKRLREFGHSAYDWTQDPAWSDPAKMHPLTIAQRDLRELKISDALIWMLDEAPSHGAPFEAGFALRSKMPVVVLWDGNPLDHLIYAHMFPVAYNLEEAVKEVELQILAKSVRF